MISNGTEWNGNITTQNEQSEKSRRHIKLLPNRSLTLSIYIKNQEVSESFGNAILA